jgi:UDP-N-acetylglucosamine diphosphorylase/glucosamine-1-phosphate N-acetyltransferase
MNVVLFDEETTWNNFLPLTFTRPISDIRLGIFTIKQKWDKYFNLSCSYLTKEYLSKKFPLKKGSNSLFIRSNVCPDDELFNALINLKPGQSLFYNERLLAYRENTNKFSELSKLKRLEYQSPILEINNLWDIFHKNGQAILSDFKLIQENGKSKTLSTTVTVLGKKSMVFLEEGAKAEACIFNTNDGPIYLGKDSEVMEGSTIRGPFILAEHSTIKMSSKIYGPTSIGPHCKVGGEINNSVILGYSNKAHDGFLGNSVIGEWCNLGADTNCSNLKNNYANVKLYSIAEEKAVDTGLQFCGLIMGDHSRCGINTMFNTGTVAGVGCNIFDGGFPPSFIPNFSWGGSAGFQTYKPDKLFETSIKVFERRGKTFDDTEREILTAVFEQKLN